MKSIGFEEFCKHLYTRIRKLHCIRYTEYTLHLKFVFITSNACFLLSIPLSISSYYYLNICGKPRWLQVIRVIDYYFCSSSNQLLFCFQLQFLKITGSKEKNSIYFYNIHLNSEVHVVRLRIESICF